MISRGTRRPGCRAVARALAMAACAFAAGVPLAGAQVYKCTDAAGRTSYSDSPCERGGKPLAIPNERASPAPDSTVCAQLLDELNRLAAERERSKAPSSSRARALTRQYESRCVGISRTPAPAK